MMQSIARQYMEKVHNSCFDSLTGLYNHGIFNQLLKWELKRFKRHATPFVLGLIDIDAFALFNRRRGAFQGDLALKRVGRVITESIRRSDLAARYNGDRFAMLLINTAAEGAEQVAERIRAGVADFGEDRLTVSIGLTSVSASVSLGVAELLDEAVEALTNAKLQGKNRIRWFEKNFGSRPSARGRILIVDDDPLNLKLIEGHLLPLGAEIIRAGSGPEGLSILSRTDIDLVLLDVMMPEMDGFEVCRRIKGREVSRMIPVILVTALEDVEQRVRGIEAGADDFITKPPNSMELIARTRSLLKVKQLNQSMASIENVLFSLANTVEAKDIYTQGHVKRVSGLAMAIGRRLDLADAELEAIKIGGILHDIGKIGVPRGILNKPGPLSEAEWQIMKRHPEDGYRICLPLKRNLRQALDVVRHHHEKMDGSGYPDGLKGDEISLPARIMAVADIYDALTTDRPYRKAMLREKAFSILLEESGQGKLDRQVVDSLMAVLQQ